MKTTRTQPAGIAVVLAALGAWASPAEAIGPDGKTLFASKCASCHGKDGKGNPAMAKMFKVAPAALDLTSAATQEKTDEALVAVVRDGRGKMPAQKGKLMGRDFTVLVQHIRGLAPVRR